MTNRDILAAATAHFAACKGHATELQALGILGALGAEKPEGGTMAEFYSCALGHEWRSADHGEKCPFCRYKEFGGAVGSSEPPPDPWRGLSGPTGPAATLSAVASVNGVIIVSGDTIHVRSDGVYVNDKNVAPQNMSGFTMLEFGKAVAPETLASMHANQEAYFGKPSIEWSEPNDPAAWAKPETPVMQKLIEEIDQWSAVVRDRDAKISTDEREIIVLRAERDAWQKMHADLNTRLQAIAPADWGHGVVPMTQYVELEGQNSALKAALDLVREESRKDVDWISAEWREVIAIKDAEIVALKAGIADARMIKADETGNHPYHGPTKPVTDADGKVTRQVVPDPTHERFHGSVGDVIAGNVMRPARDQMERALADARVKDGKTPPPFPSAHAVPDHRRIGS